MTTPTNWLVIETPACERWRYVQAEVDRMVDAGVDGWAVTGYIEAEAPTHEELLACECDDCTRDERELADVIRWAEADPEGHAHALAGTGADVACWMEAMRMRDELEAMGLPYASPDNDWSPL